MKLSKINIFLISWFLFAQLYAISLIDIVLPQFSDHDYNVGLNSDFYDYYYYKNSSGEKQYWNSYSFSVKSNFKQNLPNRSEINWKKANLYTNSIGAIDDEIALISNNFNFKTSHKFKNLDYSISFKHIKNELSYNIDKFSGVIPISINQLSTTFRGKYGKFYLSRLFGNEKSNGFQNKISGGIIGGESRLFSLFDIRVDFGKFSADLVKTDEKFCELNGINFLHYSLGSSWRELAFGVTGINVWQDARGYFDAEPFIGFYSLFFGSKTFIKKNDINLTMPFLSYCKKLKKIPLKFNLDYYHIFNNSDIVYTEGKWVIPGLLLNDKTQHHYHAEFDVDALFHLQLNSNFRYKYLGFTILASQIIPIDYSINGDAFSEISSTDKTVHGGSYFSAFVSYCF